jgi:hypothetical protein
LDARDFVLNCRVAADVIVQHSRGQAAQRAEFPHSEAEECIAVRERALEIYFSATTQIAFEKGGLSFANA